MQWKLISDLKDLTVSDIITAVKKRLLVLESDYAGTEEVQGMGILVMILMILLNHSAQKEVLDFPFKVLFLIRLLMARSVLV